MLLFCVYHIKEQRSRNHTTGTGKKMDSELFKHLFIPLHSRLYSQAIKMLGNQAEAEDALQILFLKLWERRELLHDIKDRWAYCSTMLANICNDRWRKIPVQESEEAANAIPDERNTTYEITDFENFTKQYINRLPDIQKRVMIMRMEGASTEEIEDATGLSATNIRTILSRVRQQLKKFYK